MRYQINHKERGLSVQKQIRH